MQEQWRYGEQMAARRPATYEDLIEVPEHLVAEIIDGELITSPRPRPRHAKATSVLLSALHTPFDTGRGGPGGWTIVVEPEVHLGADVLVPDIAGWRRARLPDSRPRRGFRWLPTGSVRCSHPPRRCSIVAGNFPFTPAKALGVHGWSILSRGRSKCCGARTNAGCSLGRSPDAMSFARSRLRQSRSSCPCSGTSRVRPRLRARPRA